MMSVLENVSEYWFHNYYRVLVVKTGSSYLVSVDVYRKGWIWSIDDRECVCNGEYCLLYHRVSREELASIDGLEDVIDRVVEAFIVGVKARDRLETVNVRYRIEGSSPLKYSDIEKIFYASWSLTKTNPPS